jgi:colicin import membrane protein
MENTVEEKGLRLDDLKVSSLPELQGWKEKQEQLVIDNPFVEIIDNKSYEIACKSRTSLLKGRTELEKQDKLIASKLTAFRKDVKAETESLIAITLPSEEKQQEEVKRYENVKAVAKAEEERIERERIENIEKKISDFESDSYKIIQETNIGNVEEHKTMLDAFVNDEFDYEEYEIMFEQARIRVQSYWDNKYNEVQEKEQQRLENERLKEQNLEIERKVKELQDRLDSEQRERKLKELQQKDEQFEIRKNRLDEIGFKYYEWEGFVCDEFDIKIDSASIYDANISNLEKLLSNAKKLVADAKEQKEIAEQKIKEAQELELLLKEKAEKQKEIDLELSKKDAERLKKENAERVKQLAKDKVLLEEYIDDIDRNEYCYIGKDLQNQDAKVFFESMEIRKAHLVNEFTIELNEL